MSDIPFEQIRAAGVLPVLAQLFPDETTTRHLLEDAGVAMGKLRPFGTLSQEAYWREVCRNISDGRFRDVTQRRLLQAALELWPGNTTLGGLVAASPNERELRVLCLAASPFDHTRLRLDAEHREIVLASRNSPRRITTVMHPATHAEDVARLLLDAQPDVVHFAGHGTPDGRLVLDTEAGHGRPVDLRTLGDLFAAVKPLRAVILTSCYSSSYATALDGAAEAVLGSPTPLYDECAIQFSRHFYTALGAFEPVDEAPDLQRCFRIATAAARLSGCPPHELEFHAGSESGHN